MSDHDHASMQCPNCGSQYIVQIHRSRVEKWVTSKSKYRCNDCGQQVFLNKLEIIQVNQVAREHGEAYFNFFRS